jgi:hypothetical protein
MAGKREKAEDIVLKLWQVEVLQGQGKSVHRQSTGHTEPAPIVYQVPSPQYHQSQTSSTYSVPMSCEVINNHVRCNGRESDNENL